MRSGGAAFENITLDTNSNSNLQNMKLRPFSTKNYITKPSPQYNNTNN